MHLFEAVVRLLDALARRAPLVLLLEDLDWIDEASLDLVPQPGGDGTWRLEPSVDLATTFAQEQSRRELLPASVRIQFLTRLAKLSPAARQVVMASAVLGGQTSAHQLWQVADVGVQTGIEALEEAVRSGILREIVIGSLTKPMRAHG